METIFEMGIDWKANGRRIRQAAALPTARDKKLDDAGTERPLYLSQKEAMHLLTLCAASPATLEHGEEVLFAKVHDYLRRF